MPNYTLTYSPPSDGWPSFYTYEPEWIQGMNQLLYTFNGGNLFRHNTNEERNTFYGAFGESIVQSVFHDEPVVNKVFKTLAIEGNRPWGATLVSDQQDTGFITEGYFERKEGDFFAFVRNSYTTPAEPDEYALRSLNGIGPSQTVVGNEVNFPLNISIGSILSVGDSFYHSLPPYEQIVYTGEVLDITIDLPNGINRVTHNGAGTVPGTQDAAWLGIKNQVAESHGILGHYGVFTLTNRDTEKVEMFVAKSEVMQSYPG